MATEMKVIKLRAATEPVKLSHLPTRIAKSAAMKKVLSPISDAKIRANAAKHPDLPTGELAIYSCMPMSSFSVHAWNFADRAYKTKLQDGMEHPTHCLSLIPAYLDCRKMATLIQ